MKTNHLKKKLFLIILFYLFMIPSVAFPGEFKVTPIRLDFDRGTKTGVITIVNEGGDKLNVQMRAFEWTQNADGKDQYTETKDIIFFPRIMTLEKSEEKILRAGIRIPATTKEKTYRLFIEEIPGPKKAEGVNVAIAIRFGVPIFVKPLKEEVKGEIEKVNLLKGVLNTFVKNIGNAHFIINAVDIKGKNIKGEEIFSKELSGWYLLSGVSRRYTVAIPQEVCKALSRLDIEVKTDRFKLNGKLDVDQAMCNP
jgi:fimbrial chaperone protein